jgi:hypothetical protein
MVLIGVAALVILVIIFRHRLAELARKWKLNQWNKWLGAAACFVAIWGALGIFNLGGRIGEAIIRGDHSYIGWLIVAGLFIAGLVLIFPRLFWKGFKKVVRGFIELFRLPPPRPRVASRVGAAQEKMQFSYPPSITEKQVAKTETEKEPPAARIKPPSILIPPEV